MRRGACPGGKVEANIEIVGSRLCFIELLLLSMKLTDAPSINTP